MKEQILILKPAFIGKDPLDIDTLFSGLGNPQPDPPAAGIGRGRGAWENIREAAGWDRDIMVHCSWNYDLRTSIQIAPTLRARTAGLAGRSHGRRLYRIVETPDGSVRDTDLHWGRT